MYTIKEVSQKTHLTPYTIRFYTDKGLVPNIQRNKNNTRLFNEESIEWLIRVKYLKDCGMPIKVIKHYVDLYLEGTDSLLPRYKIILEYTHLAQKQLEDAKKRVKFMQHKVKHYTELINKTNGNTSDIINTKECLHDNFIR
ncbi:MerR family transcriptional regulator [Pectinatus frisingensis]|jgi:DNA-binding transcriptional MerR regulator|uniref:MerR family transcriptional regulator n=1 Tax=Pectinatus frisingensis TaxID=865 RepID=UPI0015F733EB|nr:MerR family transcriptional regulator [Pectinatus frisingensis]